MTEKIIKMYENHQKKIFIEVYLERKNEKILLERWTMKKDLIKTEQEEEDENAAAKYFTLMRN